MNLLVLFDVELKKCFRVPTPWGLCGAEWNERFLQFLQFLVGLAMSAFLATLVPSLRGCKRGCCDGICPRAYKGRCFAVSSLGPGKARVVRVRQQLVLEVMEKILR